MRGKRHRYAIVALAVAVSGLAACGGNNPNGGGSPSPQSDVIRLGALLPLTGANAPSAANAIPAFELAVAEVNKNGGVLGRRVEVEISDDACDPETAVTEANKMITKGITVSVGGFCSSATVPTLKIFRQAGIPMVIPAANSTDLLVPGYDSVFLLAGTSDIEAQRAVQWMPTIGGHRAVVVDDGTSFSQSVADAAAKEARRPGGKVSVVQRLRLSQGASDYKRIADEIVKADGDIVFYTGYYAEAAKLLRDLRKVGYTGKILLSDGGVDPVLFKQAGKAAEGVYGVALPIPAYEPHLDEWTAKYRAVSGKDPGPFTMQAYDAVRLAVDAIRRAGTTDPAAVRQALAKTTPKDVQLLSGAADYRADGTQQNARFILLRAHNGSFALVARSGG